MNRSSYTLNYTGVVSITQKSSEGPFGGTFILSNIVASSKNAITWLLHLSSRPNQLQIYIIVSVTSFL